jgi:hypothetical protein
VIRRPASPTALAERLSLDEGALRRALEVGRALGFVRREGDVYAVSEHHAQWAERLLELARTFPEHLRTGATWTRDNQQRGELYAWVTPFLGARFRAAAERLADALASTPCETILDVGAGSGVWSLAMATRHPRAVVSALDLPAVLDRFRDHAGPHHEVIPGDYHDVVLGPRWDRVVLANVLHLEDEPRARSLLARAAAWRRPGGRIVVIDAMYRTEASDLALVSYELHLALRVESGRIYEASTIERWAGGCGLALETAVILDPSSGQGALVLR